MDIIWKPSPNYSANMGPKTVQVLHWWGNPADRPSLTGTVNWLCNPTSKVSAHYVVSGKTVYQLVKEEHVAWHAMQANGFSIGIEVDPNTPPGTYETVIALCREIATRHLMNRSTAIRAHRDYVNTQCPGNLDLGRIRAGVAAEGGGEDMTIIMRSFGGYIIAELAQPITMYNFEKNEPLWDSGTWMKLTMKTNILHGSTFYVPHDREASGELFGFREEDVYAPGNKVVHHGPTAATVDPVLAEKARKFDEIKQITG